MSDVWHVIERVAGVFLVVCFCLYIIRCISCFQLLSLDQFDQYLRELLRFIFR
jgi:CHASE2 domain-containing sensor protein